MQAFRYIRRLFLLLVLLFIGSYCYSQNILEGYWGIKAGANFNKVSNLSYSSSMKPGFHMGAFVNFQISNKFSVMHEVLFSRRGVNLSLKDGSKYSTSFSYIDLPWSLNYYMNKNFFVSAGVQPAIYAYFKSPKADSVIYNKDNVNTIDFSYFVGASFIADNNVGFGIRFNGGLVPLFTVEEAENKNYVLQAFVLYAINKKKGRRF